MIAVSLWVCDRAGERWCFRRNNNFFFVLIYFPIVGGGGLSLVVELRFLVGGGGCRSGVLRG